MANRTSNRTLIAARSAKKDEFYTQLTDIEKELRHYKAQFRGKVVYCNCDDPNESNFVKYFKLNFEHLGLKKLIATHFKDADLLTRAVPYRLEYAGNGKKSGAPDERNVKIAPLKGNGDFRSDECIALLRKSDIVVTNPPFSLFREYVAQLMEHQKKFLILGQQNAITYKECFGYIKEGRMWLGYDNGGTKWFQVPNDYDIETESRKKIQNGVKYFSMESVFWYTNLDHTKRHELLTLYRRYSPHEYPQFDNYDAINVNRVSEIPMDYGGVVGVPITFVDKFNPDQFEIIDANDVRRSELVPLKPHGLVKDKEGAIRGKPTYVRILIRNKARKI